MTLVELQQLATTVGVGFSGLDEKTLRRRLTREGLPK